MPYMRMVKIATNNESQTEVELEIINIGDRPAHSEMWKIDCQKDIHYKAAQ